MRSSTSPFGGSGRPGPALRRQILAAFASARGRLPEPTELHVRPNVSRLVSLTRPAPGRVRLNLSTAVVEAGPEAWALLGPALLGDRPSVDRLQRLCLDGMRANRRKRMVQQRSALRTGPGQSRPLPRTPCEGEGEERRYLLTLLEYLREVRASAEVVPRDVQVRISARMTSRLGSCRWSGTSRRITISRRLFRPGLEDILWETVKHEVAHLADQVTSRNGRTSHGRGWKAWARRMGARPVRLCGPEDSRRIDEADRKGRSGPLRYPPEVERWLEGHRG